MITSDSPAGIAAQAAMRQAGSQVGLAARYTGPESERTQLARRDYRVAELAVHILAVLDHDPPPTAAQLAQLRGVLNSAGQQRGAA